MYHWVPPEDKDATLLMAPTRESVSLFGAVNIRKGSLVTQYEKEKFNALTFNRFLIHLLRYRPKGRKIWFIAG
jgi:hypothetical protein